jgi:hypothetical protein
MGHLFEESVHLGEDLGEALAADGLVLPQVPALAAGRVCH